MQGQWGGDRECTGGVYSSRIGWGLFRRCLGAMCEDLKEAVHGLNMGVQWLCELFCARWVLIGAVSGLQRGSGQLRGCQGLPQPLFIRVVNGL